MEDSATARRADPGSKHKRRTSGGRNPPRSSLTQRIYEQLRTDILTGALEPGLDLSEAMLAARFAVSKTPVREALATLRSEGFVRTFPRRGYQIAPITFRDLNELFDVRTILEAGAAELACERISDVELARLEHLAETTYDPREQPTLRRFVQANREFHTAIASACGNSRLTQMVVRQLEELERFLFLGARLRDLNLDVKSDHHQIVKVLRGRSPDAARQVMIEHNAETRRALVEALLNTQGIGSAVAL